MPGPGTGLALLTVDDDGIGIAPEHRADAFAMFRRLHPRSTHPGNGMGLPLCRGIAEAHGGEIWLDSSPLDGYLDTVAAVEQFWSSTVELPRRGR